MANFSHPPISSGTDHEPLTHSYTHPFGGNWVGSHLSANHNPSAYNYPYLEPARSDLEGTEIDPWSYQPNNSDMAPEPQTVFRCRPSALPMNR
jgi:hypothetical protein